MKLYVIETHILVLIDLVPGVGFGSKTLVMRHHDDALPVLVHKILENGDHLIGSMHIKIAGRLFGDDNLVADRQYGRDREVLLLAAYVDCIKYLQIAARQRSILLSMMLSGTSMFLTGENYGTRL